MTIRIEPVRADDPLAVSAAWFWAVLIGLLLVAAVPLLWTRLPPLFDYPNHLARMYLLSHLPSSQILQRYYELRWQLLPNLGMDEVVPALARVLALDWAAKVFIFLSMAMIVGGAAFVHRAATGRWTLWPLFAFLFLYSRILLWGFLNYLFGVGLALVAFGFWIALAKRRAALRLLVSALFALAAFFAHLMACVLYGILVGGFELGEIVRERPFRLLPALGRLVVAALAFVPPLALLLAGEGGIGGGIHYGRLVRKLDLLFSVLDDYDRVFDVGCFVVLVVLAGVAFATRRLTIVPSLRFPLLLLAIAYLAAPSQIMTASAVDHRLPLVIAVLLAAATVAPRMPTRWARLVAIAGLALFVGRMGLVEVAWQRAGAVYDRLLAVLDRVPVGARLAVAFPSEAIASDPVPKTHLPVLAIARRDAFVPTLFAYRGQQPIAFTATGARLAAEAEPNAVWRALMGEPDGAASALAGLADYDLLVALDRRPFTLPATPLLEPLAVEPDFALYRVRH